MKKILFLLLSTISVISCNKDDVTPSYTVTITVDPNLSSVYKETWSIRMIGDNGKQVDIEKTQDLISRGGFFIFYKDGTSDLPDIVAGKSITFTNVPKGKYLIYVYGEVLQTSSALSFKKFHYSKWAEIGESQDETISILFPEGVNIVHE